MHKEDGKCLEESSKAQFMHLPQFHTSRTSTSNLEKDSG